ncbi:MAG TPA: metallophosphoesterase [Gemmatimonadales bacterium]|nr:metallophosphoesterase [Gemmatimonadales bacterium]
MTAVTLVHLSDLHFGRDADLAQIRAIAALMPSIAPDVICVSGDLTQRARHGEFQAALGFFDRLQAVAPTITLPGNHDVQWWESPFHLLGTERLYAKYRRWFGLELTPTLERPGVIVCTALTSHGVAAGSMTSNLNDMAVKGHLPASEVERVRRCFAAAAPGAARVLMLHHNVLRGSISRRMGLARPEEAQQRLIGLAPDVILTGHDHEETTALLGDRIVVSAASTHTRRTRGQRPSAFNALRLEPDRIGVRHWWWSGSAFTPSDETWYPRVRRQGADVAG